MLLILFLLLSKNTTQKQITMKIGTKPVHRYTYICECSSHLNNTTDIYSIIMSSIKHHTVECLIFARTLLREFREAP